METTRKPPTDSGWVGHPIGREHNPDLGWLLIGDGEPFERLQLEWKFAHLDPKTRKELVEGCLRQRNRTEEEWCRVFQTREVLEPNPKYNRDGEEE